MKERKKQGKNERRKKRKKEGKKRYRDPRLLSVVPLVFHNPGNFFTLVFLKYMRFFFNFLTVKKLRRTNESAFVEYITLTAPTTTNETGGGGRRRRGRGRTTTLRSARSFLYMAYSNNIRIFSSDYWFGNCTYRTHGASTAC